MSNDPRETSLRSNRFQREGRRVLLALAITLSYLTGGAAAEGWVSFWPALIFLLIIGYVANRVLNNHE